MKLALKTLLASFIILSLIFCSGCMEFLKGSTKVLDLNPIETLKADYDENYPAKDLDVKAQIISESSEDVYYIKVRFLNNDPDNIMTVYGYGYCTFEPVSENTKKMLFFNVEKNVANSTYKSVIPKGGYCADVIYEIQEPTVRVTPDTLVFVFFSIDGKYYAGGATINDDFVYWEIENHELED